LPKIDVAGRRTLKLIGVSVIAATFALIAATANRVSAADWRTASHESVGLAPDPATTPAPVVQVYAARTWGWRGTFGVHTWIAVKRADAPVFTVYEVIGWHLRWSDSAVVARQRDADARWFGSPPELLADKRGEGVEALIGRIETAVRSYPYAGEYSVWPGPNSNTFTAWVLRHAPELQADLPPTAIGKDYLGERIVASAPSGSGVQFSLRGVLGVLASEVEGLEVNLLGLSFGINPFDFSLRLPLLGRIGPARRLEVGVARNAPETRAAPESTSAY
jgi:hypothetical protein